MVRQRLWHLNHYAGPAWAALLWLASFYPAWQMKPLFLLAFTPLIGMACDAPNTPCGQTIVQIYGLVFGTILDAVVLSVTAVSGALSRSWPAAGLFMALNWGAFLWMQSSPFFR